jgi:hypothetical protein
MVKLQYLPRPDIESTYITWINDLDKCMTIIRRGYKSVNITLFTFTIRGHSGNSENSVLYSDCRGLPHQGMAVGNSAALATSRTKLCRSLFFTVAKIQMEVATVQTTREYHEVLVELL